MVGNIGHPIEAHSKRLSTPGSAQLWLDLSERADRTAAQLRSDAR